MAFLLLLSSLLLLWFQLLLPSLPILASLCVVAGIFTYCGLTFFCYRTFGISYIGLANSRNYWTIGYWFKAHLSDYRISDSQKSIGCPALLNFPSNGKISWAPAYNILKSSTATVPGMGLCGSCIWQVFSLHGFYNHTGLLLCSRTDVIVALSAGGLNSSVEID